MEILTLCTLIILVFLFTGFFWKLLTRNTTVGKKMPGPPIFEGMRRFITSAKTNTLHLYLYELADKYGDLIQINLLAKNVVIVNDPDLFRKLVKDPNLRDFTNDRPVTFCREVVNGGDKDIILGAYGPLLQQRRKLFHNILKFYGEGKSHFEEIMLSSLEKLKLEFMEKETVELSLSIRKYILFLVSFLLTGDISDTGKKNLPKLQNFSDDAEIICAFQNESFLQTMPSLRFIPGLRFKRLYLSICDSIKSLHDAYFYPTKNAFNPHQRRGMIDELLAIQQDPEENGQNLQMDDSIIKALIQDVVSAGYLTTSSTLSSMFLFLLKHPDVKNRMYDEIKRVVGDASPSFQHRLKMPYSEAVMLETLRITSSVPLLLPHMVSDDVTFEGYYMPKSTILFMNAWYCHHQESFWKDPFSFRPDRFLDADGHLLKSDHPLRLKLIPFGSGSRACPGELFGKSRVFLISTFLLQNFDFLPLENEVLPSLNPRDWHCGTISSPDNYRCKIQPRDAS